MELPKRRSKATRHLTEAQLDDLVAHAVAHESPRTAAIVALLKGTACRISELTDVHLDALGHTGAHRILTLPAKGDRDHQVVIAEVTGRILDAYLAERGNAPGPLLVTRTGLPLRRSYVLELIQRLAEAVGIPDPKNVSLHSIRHSVATALLQAGEPLDVVQALLGHADPRTTQAYLHVEELERSPAARADARLAAALARGAGPGAPPATGPAPPPTPARPEPSPEPGDTPGEHPAARRTTGTARTASPAAHAPAARATTIHQIKITLREVAPPIWRRLHLPSTATLRELHRVIQIAMGWASAWEDYHLHLFACDGAEYGHHARRHAGRAHPRGRRPARLPLRLR